jgi:hypothetical protein
VLAEDAAHAGATEALARIAASGQTNGLENRDVARI